MRRVIALALTACFVGAASAQQQWPTGPVRVIVNVAPGGVADRTMRMIGARLTDVLGHPTVVENRAGGEGYIGIEAVARAEPDGQTFLFSPGSTIMITPHLVPRADLDPVKGLAAVAPTVRVSLFLVTVPGLPARTLADFIEYGRANADKLNYGSAGTGTSPHIAAEVFKRETRIRMTHVPYKGAGPALKDLLGGQFEVMFDPGIGLEHVKAGRLRLLAVAAESRHPDFPDTPTFAEAGIRGVDGGPYFGLYAPPRTSRAVIERMNQLVAKLMAEPDMRKRLVATGLDVAPTMAPDAFAAYVRAESERYAKLLPELGIRPE